MDLIHLGRKFAVCRPHDEKCKPDCSDRCTWIGISTISNGWLANVRWSSQIVFTPGVCAAQNRRRAALGWRCREHSYSAAVPHRSSVIPGSELYRALSSVARLCQQPFLNSATIGVTARDQCFRAETKDMATFLSQCLSFAWDGWKLRSVEPTEGFRIRNLFLKLQERNFSTWLESSCSMNIIEQQILATVSR